MAEFASNLNEAHQNHTGRPSVFDLLAQESLRLSIRPAFEFLIKTLSLRYPEAFCRISRYSNEIYHIFLALSERHFIWNHSASFSENFYGLSRSNFAPNGTSPKLSNFQKVASLVSLTVVPYLKSRIEKYYDQIKTEVTTTDLDSKSTNVVHRFVAFFYPFIHAVMETVKLVMLLCYTVRVIDFHTPSCGLLNMRLVYAADETLNDFMTNDLPTYSTNYALIMLQRMYGFVKQGFSFALEYALPVTVFFLKFLEWWYSNENSPENLVDPSSLPPPPKQLQLNFSHNSLPSHPSQCPICHRVLQNPTTLSRTGNQAVVAGIAIDGCEE